MGCSSSKTTTTGGDIAVVASGDEKGNVKSEVGVVEKWDKKNEVRAIDETQSELGKEKDRGATKSQKIKLAKQESKKLRLEERKQAVTDAQAIANYWAGGGRNGATAPEPRGEGC